MVLKQYIEYKDSGVEWISDIPSHWNVIKFKHVSELLNGYAFNSDSFEDEGLPIIRIGDITENISLENTKRVKPELLPKLKRFIIKKNDILLALSGATVGKSSIYPSNEVALLNQRVGIIRSKYTSVALIKPDDS